MSVQHLITSYSYLAIFVLMAIESACIPVPSEVIMLCGGAIAANSAVGQHVSLALTIIAGCLGNVVGGFAAWAVGRRSSDALLRRCSDHRWVHGAAVRRAEQWCARYGAPAVVLGRLVPGVRTFISLPAGVSGMSALAFGLCSTIGCLAWSVVLAGFGFRIGRDWPAVVDRMHGAETYLWILPAAVLPVAVALLFRLRHSLFRDVAK